MSWTSRALITALQDQLGAARLIVVANREPYIHRRHGSAVVCMRPASGLVSALDPVMRACGGTWIAHGSGDADRETADQAGRLQVPVDDPAYTLRRVWLTKEEEEGYYYGFSNEALWPLCHIAHLRPIFRASDWDMYRRVNQKFAEVALEEMADRPAIVFVQDYHFALLPRIIKQRRPDTIVCQFWHIPWPNREAFRICPWGRELLDGLLGNDLLGFHVQHDCNNFLDTVDRGIEARVDYEHFSVTRGGRPTRVRPFPIGIDPEAAEYVEAPAEHFTGGALRRRLGIGDEAILLGVDRLDYTKGIPERLRSIERLLERYPEQRGKFVFVQVAAPSRSHIAEYRRLEAEVEDITRCINQRFGTRRWWSSEPRWKPILLLKRHHGPDELIPLYRAARACVVSSLHDGMNLVAKEFVAARTDYRGALVLSRFTGAARELDEALLVNPYALDEMADALYQALTMLPGDQEWRMRRLGRTVGETNIYRWAGMLLSEACKLADTRAWSSNGQEAGP
jgi:trehalose 6-phosphate synthase